MGRSKESGRPIKGKTFRSSALRGNFKSLISKAFVQLSMCLGLSTLLALGLSHVTQAATSRSADFQPSSAIWKIHQEGEFMATAFAIGNNRFITNAQLIRTLAYRGNGEIRLIQEGSDVKLRWSKLLAISMTYNLALFETTESARDYLTIANTFSWEQESDLYAMGYQEGSLQNLDKVGEIIYNDDLSYAIPMSRVLGHGFGGSPIISGREVVAVTAMTDENIGYAVTLENLKGLLGEELGKPRLGVSCSHLSMRLCIDRGIEETRRLAIQEGSKVALYQLGRGQSYINESFSTELLEMSARQGFPRASAKLGSIHYNSSLGEEDEETANRLQEIAADWHKRAADEGHLESQTELYFLYYYGEGVPQDRSLALVILTGAASAGYALAEHNLGIVYRDGIGVPSDRKRGAFWLQRAADKGY